MNITVLTFTPEGTVQCLWTEIVPLHELGRLEIQRASNVEFNSSRQHWEVHSRTGRLLYSHRSRTNCLAWEHSFFNH
jgi:hypothetical protein